MRGSLTDLTSAQRFAALLSAPKDATGSHGKYLRSSRSVAASAVRPYARHSPRVFDCLRGTDWSQECCFSKQRARIMQSKSILAAVGVIAIIFGGIYFINQSQKSDAEKLGDSLEKVGDDIADAVEDATD